MKGSARYYEQKALEALSAAYTSSTNVEYNLAASQVYATLAQAAAIDDVRDDLADVRLDAAAEVSA